MFLQPRVLKTPWETILLKISLQGKLQRMQENKAPWGRSSRHSERVFRLQEPQILVQFQRDFKLNMYIMLSEINEDHRIETKGKSRHYPSRGNRFEKEKLLVINSKVITTQRYQYFDLSKFQSWNCITSLCFHLKQEWNLPVLTNAKAK